MKLTFIFLIVCFLQTYANGYGQKVKISLDIENVTLEQAFEHIEKITDYRFLYSAKSVNLNRKISISLYKEPLYTVIQQLFKATNVSFKIKDKQIVLKTIVNKAKRSRRIQPSEPQKRKEISGIVIDENNLPLGGVTILVSGTQNGTITDIDGFYSIMAEEDDVLIFSYLGYLDYEVVINTNSVYDVKMIPTTVNLQGVEVVYNGFQKIEKDRISGSFANVKEEILEVKTEQNILAKIADEVPGILFSPNNGIIIRGQSSINGTTAPLIVVDGLPTALSINDINPNDVQDITILRDAASASIWGVRAANGVIVIVTKGGNRNSKTKIETSINTAITQKIDIFDNEFASTATQIEFQRALFEIEGDLFDPDNTLFLENSGDAFAPSRFFQRDPVQEVLLRQAAGELNQSQVNALLNEIATRDPRREYDREILRPEIWNQYSLAVSGGSDKQDFRASVTFNRNQFNTVNNKSNQIIANFRNSINLSKKLKTRFIVNFSQTQRDRAPEGINDNLDILGYDPSSITGFLNNVPLTSRLRDSNGNFEPLVGGSSLAFSEDLLRRGGAFPFTFNVLEEFANANNSRNTANLRLQTALDYKISKNLDATVTYQYELGGTENRNVFNENSFQARSRVNIFSQLGDEGTIIEFPLPIGEILDTRFSRRIAHTFRGQVNYDTDFNNGLHRITAIGGYEARLIIRESDADRRYGFNNQTLVSIDPDFDSVFDNLLDGNVLQGSFRIPSGANSTFVEDRFISYFANLAYTFFDNYTLTASTRLDDTNLFGASNEFRNIPLYSVGGKWNISNDFFPLSDTVNNLQLRATFGTNGNVARGAGPFLQATVFQQNQNFRNQAAAVTNLPNPLLRLERTKTFNLGLDYGFFNNVISGSVELYDRTSEDLLSNVALNPTLGASQSLLNAGVLSNQGVDVNLNINLGNPANFAYEGTLNFSYNKNRLERVDVNQDRIGTFINGAATIEGEALNTIFSYRYANLDRNGAPQFLNRNNEILDFRFNNPISPNDNFTVQDLKREGTLVPVYFGSWINNFSYKNLSLRILTNFRAGHVFRYTGDAFIPRGTSGGVANNVTREFLRRWQNPGDENFTDVPGLPLNINDLQADGYINYPNTDRFVDDASHIRLSQIVMAYTFTSRFLKKTGLQSLRLGLQLDDIAVWNFNRWNVDPENSFIPQPTTFTINFNASF